MRPLVSLRTTREGNIKKDLKEIGWEEWTGFIWLRIGTVGGC